MCILIRLKLKSFSTFLLQNTISLLKVNLSNLIKSIIYIALPNHIKSFCVLRSPHIDKDSREHLALFTYSGFFDFILPNINIILDYIYKEIPFGVSYKISILKELL